MNSKSPTAWRKAGYAAFVLLALMTGQTAFAGGCPAVTITGYYVYSNANAYITTSGNQNPDSCVTDHYLALDSTQPNFKAIWAQVIAAQANGQTVSLYYLGCNGSYPLIIAIAVPNVW